VKVVNFDESGDLGFNFENERTSKYFIVTFLMADKQKQLLSVNMNTINCFLNNPKLEPDSDLSVVVSPMRRPLS
jgi:hypothetical protein